MAGLMAIFDQDGEGGGEAERRCCWSLAGAEDFGSAWPQAGGLATTALTSRTLPFCASF